MAQDWLRYEERIARWTTVISAVPAIYGGYVIWRTRHPWADFMILTPLFVFSLYLCFALVLFVAVLNTFRLWTERHASSKSDQATSNVMGVASPVLLDAQQTRALELAAKFTEMLASLPPCPAINLERSYGQSPEQVAKVLEEELRTRSEWEDAASRGYAKLAEEINTAIDDFANRGVHEEHLDRLRSEGLPQEEFVQIPRYLRRLMADSF